MKTPANLRAVVQVFKNPQYNVHCPHCFQAIVFLKIGKKKTLVLECGHTKVIPSCIKTPKRSHCDVCTKYRLKWRRGNLE